jgi:ubiquinone/menaquinone biosynthesis C-methylase UbiE
VDAKAKGDSPGVTGFDGLASRYEAWYDHPANRLLDSLEMRALRDRLPTPSKDALLLDVGVGTGHWVPLASGAGYTVIGLDKSEAMLKVAATKAGTEHLLIRGDAHCLPFPDGCFDAVLSVTTLEFVGDPVRATEEMLRCLKPGRSLVVGVLNAISFLGLRRKVFRSSTFRGARFFTIAELRRLLSKAGDIRVATCAFMPPSRVEV